MATVRTYPLPRKRRPIAVLREDARRAFHLTPDDVTRSLLARRLRMLARLEALGLVNVTRHQLNHYRASYKLAIYQ